MVPIIGQLRPTLESVPARRATIVDTVHPVLHTKLLHVLLRYRVTCGEDTVLDLRLRVGLKQQLLRRAISVKTLGRRVHLVAFDLDLLVVHQSNIFLVRLFR